MRGPELEPTAGEPLDHWMMYSDLMAGLVMVFILFLAVTIVSYHQQLKAKEARINQLLGVQSSIVHSLERKFQKSHLTMQIDPSTGSILFASDVLFGFNSYQLSPQGQQDLQAFIPAYISVLLSPRYRSDISAIIVKGYTDRQGTYLYNLNLSQRRALAVVNYIFSPGFPPVPYRALLKQDITAEGRSFNDPVYVNGQYSASASRRVIFAFRLKSAQIMKAVQQTAGGP